MSLRNVLLLLFALIFFACNNANDETNKTVDTAITNQDEHEGDHHEEHVRILSLDNGAKWQSDESTRTHTAKLNAEVDAFNTKANADVTDYQTFASAMQKELNALVSDCKMKGTAHDALHLWLEPVLQDISDLKKVTNTEEGKHATEKLTADIKKFNQYFN